MVVKLTTVVKLTAVVRLTAVVKLTAVGADGGGEANNGGEADGCGVAHGSPCPEFAGARAGHPGFDCKGVSCSRSSLLCCLHRWRVQGG